MHIQKRKQLSDSLKKRELTKKLLCSCKQHEKGEPEESSFKGEKCCSAGYGQGHAEKFGAGVKSVFNLCRRQKKHSSAMLPTVLFL